MMHINTLRPRQNGRHFADDTFKRIFLKENVRISIKISLKFVPKGPIDNIPALFEIMAWRRPGDKPLSEAMVVSLLTHICVVRPQWVNIHPLTSCWLGTWLTCGTVDYMMTSSHWNALLFACSSLTGGFPHKGPVMLCLACTSYKTNSRGFG